MKIERLLGIVVYLLNREIVNANTLAEKFEVSTRTIQRDIETLNLAGIPITALMGMDSAYNNKRLETTLEKLLNVSKQEQPVSSKVKLDFSVSREGNNIDNYLKIIEDAIDNKKVIEFEYLNSYGDKTLRAAEPIGVIYIVINISSTFIVYLYGRISKCLRLDLQKVVTRNSGIHWINICQIKNLRKKFETKWDILF